MFKLASCAFCLVSVSLVVSTGAFDCLERVVPCHLLEVLCADKSLDVAVRVFICHLVEGVV